MSDQDTAGFQVTASIGKGALRTGIQAGRHELLADEPRDAGGDDAGLWKPPASPSAPRLLRRRSERYI